MRILAVDDDQSIRELLPMILEEARVTDVTLASSAANALNAIEASQENFDCFLLDIQMPGGDGIELCRNIRKLPAYQKTPIIMLTAMQEKSFIDAAFAAGANDYTTKPFDISEICARIRMARFLIDEQRKVSGLAGSSVRSNEGPVEHPETDFTAPLDVGDVKGLITKNAFENYLGQLSRVGIQSSSFYAIHFQNGRKVFDRCSRQEYEFAIRHIADAAIASLRPEGAIVCYVGTGNFICNSNTSSRSAINSLEASIQNILDDRELTYDDGSPLDIDIVVGPAFQPLMNGPLQMDGIESQTINRAMAKAKEKCAATATPNIRSITP